MAKAKKIAQPTCQESAAKVIQRVLLVRLKKMCALRERALHWNDPEGVHAMRVASRRLRSAVSDFKPYIRKDSIPSQRLKAIAQSLGAVRDEDVVLAALEKLRSRADSKVAEGIEAIAKDHRRRQQRARSVLESAIRPAALAELRDDLRSKIRTAVKIPAERPAGEADADRVLTFSQVGVRVIGFRLQQLSEAGNSVYRPLQTKNLHELRIHANDESRKFATEIAHFQTSLGELHDCDVWIDNLESRLKQDRKRKSGAGRDPGRNNETIVWLLQHFASERTKHYCRALGRWHQWETEGFLDRLRTVLNAGFNPIASLPKKQQRRSAVKPGVHQPGSIRRRSNQ